MNSYDKDFAAGTGCGRASAYARISFACLLASIAFLIWVVFFRH